ncbi:MAG: response regulator [Thermodesulfobacteriota bacterium]|nr:response regulator [Thermodesulfobacteriota bacterium]
MEKGKHMILVVDDEKLIRWSLTQSLEGNGWDVISAETGEEALEKARQTMFHVVITDLRLPGMDGIDLLKEIKQINPDCQIIIISAYGTSQLAAEAKKLGAYDFIDKPFKIDEMKEVVRTMLVC